MADIDPGLGTDCVEDRNGGIDRVGVHYGDRAVQGHGRVGEILEHVRVVQTVRFVVVCTLSCSSREVQTCRMLGNTIKMAMTGEVEVDRQ